MESTFPGLTRCWKVFQEYSGVIAGYLKQKAEQAGNWVAETNKKVSPWVHGTLDAVGLAAPMIGGAIGSAGAGNLVGAAAGEAIATGADAINALWYLAEGDWGNAALSGFSAIPIVGYLGNLTKAGKHAFKNSKYLDDIAELISRYGDNAVELFTKYSDKILPLVKKSPQLAEFIFKNPNSAEFLLKNADDVIAKYGDDAIEMLSEGVVAKRLTQEGHTLKVLANGKLVRCSTCGEIAEQFSDILADPKNTELAKWFEGVQERAAKDPEGVADEIKIIEEELQNLRKNNPNTATEVVSSATKVTQITEAANALGYSSRIPPQKAPFDSHGQPVFSNGKNYISPDVDSHNVTNGWKMFDRKGRRIGTYNSDFSERIKD
jgi:hypothetical protein